MPIRLACLLIIGALAAKAHSAERTSERYTLDAFSRAVYGDQPSAERRVIRKATEPIGTLGRPSHPEAAAVWVYDVMLAHVTQSLWKDNGGDQAERTAVDSKSFTIRAPAETHKQTAALLNALMRPRKLNPKATQEDIQKAAAYTSEDGKMVTAVYLIDQLPVRATGVEFQAGKTTRAEAVQRLKQRIRDEVERESWSEHGQTVANVDELSGRLIVTNTPEVHLAIAKQLQIWVND